MRKLRPEINEVTFAMEKRERLFIKFLMTHHCIYVLYSLLNKLKNIFGAIVFDYLIPCVSIKLKSNSNRNIVNDH